MNEEALKLINNAVKEVRKAGPREVEENSIDDIARSLQAMSEGTLQALSAAIKVHRAVYRTALEEAALRIRRSDLHPEPAETGKRGAQDGEKHVGQAGSVRGPAEPFGQAAADTGDDAVVRLAKGTLGHGDSFLSDPCARAPCGGRRQTEPR